MSQKILLVGGGTGGHIFPLHPLTKPLLDQGHEVSLMVNQAPLDQQVIEDKFKHIKGLKIYYLKTHKIDYHLSLRNLIAPFLILQSFFRTKKLLKKIAPEVVFFKGGFVGFPVLVALKYLMRFDGKIYLHDSDISAGKLTQLIGKNANHIFTNFGPHATPLFYWPSEAQNVRTLKLNPQNDFKRKKPRILIFGGSQGAQFLNNLIIQKKEELTKKYDITLVAGPKNQVQIDHPNLSVHNFMPQDQLIQAMLDSDLVICRSGASMFQVLAAKARCIAIPLPTSARNHQYHNAQYFADKGLCYLLEQNQHTAEALPDTIEKILKDKTLAERLNAYQGMPRVEAIVQKISK